MRREAYARRPEGRVDLDICVDCQAIWFDTLESPALAPSGVLALFHLIRERVDRPVPALLGTLRCVRCHERLELTHDVQRTERIVYYRCPEGHGRFTTFLQFLREKRFLRTLTPPEVRKLAATVAQVRCSGCGGPIDLARDARCPYCGAPIAILDVEALHAQLVELENPDRENP